MVDYFIKKVILQIMTVNENPEIGKVIGAFSSATRRKIIFQLLEGDMTVKTIADKNQITKQAASKQKNILAESGIIKERKSGRELYCSINPQALTIMKDYVSRMEIFWDRRLNKLKDLVES